MKSIKHTMTVYFSLLIILTAASLSVFAYYQAANSLETAAATGLENVALEASKVIDARLESKLLLLETIANRNIIRGTWGNSDTTWQQKLEILLAEKDRGGFMFLSIADKNGNATSTNGKTVNIADRSYFKKALQGQRSISDSILNKETNSVTYAFAVPIKALDGNTISSVLIGMVSASEFNSIVRDITYGKEGYAFAISTDGTMVAHPDEQLVLTQDNSFKKVKSDSSLASLVSLEQRMVRGEKGSGMYEYKGIEKMLGFAPIKITGWSVAVAAPQDEVLAGAKSLALSMAFITALIIILAGIAIFYISGKIALPLSLAAGHLQTIADNDYTNPIPPEFLSKQDEVGVLAQAIDSLQSKVKSTLLAVKSSALSVSQQSENLSAASEEMASTSGQVAATIQEVAKGSTQQAQDMDQLSMQLSGVADNMNDIYNQLKQVKETADKTAQKAEHGKIEMDQLVGSIDTIQRSFAEVAELIEHLAESVGQIGDITETINAIAGQTNLLALNAAIEAARAGEAGRGFAVVAEEVRKLAEQSKASSDDIQNLVTGVISETTTVKTTTAEVSSHVKSQSQTVTNTVLAFDHILNSIEQIAPLIDQTYEAVDKTVKAKDILLSKVENVSAVITQTSAATEEIAASSEQVSASTQEIASSAQHLNHAANDMMEKVNQFKLS